MGGGGGVIRAVGGGEVVRVAAFNVRRLYHPNVNEARKAAKPATVHISSSSDKTTVLKADEGKKEKDPAAVQRPSWELDDWEFAGGEEESLVDSDDPLPRIVFGGAPTPQEAKVATSELKDAIEKVYLSSPEDSDRKKDYPPRTGSSSSSSSSVSSLFPTETKSNPVPRNAIQAFQMLSENPAAQSVVASIACDPNVWLAVMDNHELKEFLLSKMNNNSSTPSSSSSSSSSLVPLVKESMVCIEFPVDEEDPSFLEKKLDELEEGLKNFAKKVKNQAMEMVNNISIYLNNIFGIQVGEKGYDDDQTGKFSLMEKALGTSFLGLAIMVVMVVILKRT